MIKRVKKWFFITAVLGSSVYLSACIGDLTWWQIAAILQEDIFG
jgi:hypothetical protein